MKKYHVEFCKIGRQWSAIVTTTSPTHPAPVCVSWQTPGTLRNVRKIIKTQLEGDARFTYAIAD